MARIKIDLPPGFSFETEIPVRITDLNYGKHVGNDTVLSIIHEARVRYLASLGYTEMNLEGVGLIMADTAIEFKKEIFYPSTLRVAVTAGDFSRVGFDLYYEIRIVEGEKTTVAVAAKTGMVCFDYEKRKVAAVPTAALAKLGAAI